MARKPKQKTLTLDDFAKAIHEDYLAIRKEMATKADMEDGFKKVREEMATQEDIGKLRNEMATHAALREVHEDVKRLNEIMVSKADLEEAIQRKLDTSPFAKERDLTDLRLRVRRVEQKLGMKASDRAA